MKSITIVVAAVFFFLGAALTSFRTDLITKALAQPTALGTLTVYTGENLWLLESIGRNQTKIWACTASSSGSAPACKSTELRFDIHP